MCAGFRLGHWVDLPAACQNRSMSVIALRRAYWSTSSVSHAARQVTITEIDARLSLRCRLFLLTSSRTSSLVGILDLPLFFCDAAAAGSVLMMREWS